MNLTLKDWDLLQALSLNARASLTSIAKQVKISKQALSYRLQLLEENNILLGTHAVINTYALGRSHFRLFIKYYNMTSKQEEEYYTYLNNNSNIPWYALCDGEFDNVVIVWAKSIQEYDTTYRNLMKTFGKYFENIQFSVATEINYYKHNFLTSSKDFKMLAFSFVKEKINLDQLDKKIIFSLNKNAKTSLVTLANENEVSTKLIHDRIKKLEKQKVILGYNTKINHKKLGFTHRKVQLWLNNTSEKTIITLTTHLQNQPSTIFTVLAIGGADLEFELMTKTNEEFYVIMKTLRVSFPELITSYSSFIVYEEPKNGFMDLELI